MKYFFTPTHTHARACCESTGHPVSSQETRQSSHITLDFIMGVLKSIYGCQTIHHFPSQSSAENSHPALTVLLGRFYKSSEVNPRTGNLSLTLGFLWDAPVKGKQIAKGSKILSQLGYLCVLPALTKISLHPSILLVSLMSGVPEQKEIWLLLFLEFRAWSASKDPSAVFQINAS